MGTIKKIFRTMCFVAIIIAAMSFTKFSNSAVKSNLIIHFKNYVGKDLLKFDTVNYQNEAGQTYTISKFKYYVGNIRLQNTDGSTYTSPQYFLINEDNEASKEVILKDVPEGNYTSIGFIIGVDSVHNCSGAQSGALDPMNAMFWAWNTGYIFLKVEGHSPASKSTGHIFEFHIGGYKAPANCIRNVALSFNHKNLPIVSGKNASVVIKADASEIFKNPVTIDFSKISSVTDFHNSATIANNYADMFSILSIE